MNVIIIEDDKVLSLLLSKMIERIGFNVLEVIAKGHEAVKKVPKLKPDLIFMDIMLEDDLDGIEVMHALRDHSIQTPVIYITGNSDAYNKERALTTDFVDYLIKPISYEQLSNSVQKVQVN